jgi:two-component system, sensor histidine kinase PdtaS
MLQRLDSAFRPLSSVWGMSESIGLKWLFPRPGVAISQILIIALVLPMLFFGAGAYRDWRNIEAEAEARIASIRDALAEHVLRVFKTHQLIAYSVRDRIAASSWDGIAGSAELEGYLATIENDFPEVRAIWLIDGEGLLRASSGGMAAGSANFADEPWFVGLREGAEDVTVGRRRDGGWGEDLFTINFRRGIRDAPFNGLIQIAVSPRYFEKFYASTYPNQGVIALVHSDGGLLMRYPPHRSAVNSPFFTNMSAEAVGLVTQRSSVDGVERHYGYARIADYPVYVGFGLGEEELQRIWRTRLQSYGAYFIPTGFALLLLSLYAWRSHRNLEDTVELRTAALSSAIAEKNQLLKEVHHRVKNNMQIISSLIRMQERVQTSPDETIRRVQAMALVHDLIYTHDAFASVNLAAYAHRMLDSMKSVTGGNIVFDLDLEPVTVALDRAMPFALILSEIVTNATRHAFPERRGKITISLRREGGAIELCVSDDGIGHNSEVDGRGFGMRLVKSLAVQLGAEISFVRDEGTHFRMTFATDAANDRVESRVV